MKIGIDNIGFYTSNLFLDMAKLAKKRNEDPNKYLIGIGQEKMAVIPKTQDIVTLGANAASQIVTNDLMDEIDLVIVGTESGMDNSKSAAAYIANLLGLKNSIRTFEIKQACYGATAGLQMAKDYIQIHPDKKALVIGADIAKYGLKTKGEPTQGGGAVAMLVSANPKLLAFDGDSTYYAEDVMDFWRPLGYSEAKVDGKFSTNVYLDFLSHVYADYQDTYGSKLTDFASFTFHLPYTKQGLKAIKFLIQNEPEEVQASYLNKFEASRKYNKIVGNLYTGSLYLSLLSLLENADFLKENDKIGLYSYGSGAQGEFFAMKLVEGFQSVLTDKTKNLLAKREEISVEEYEKIYQSTLNYRDNEVFDVTEDHARYVLAKIDDTKRIYIKQF